MKRRNVISVLISVLLVAFFTLRGVVAAQTVPASRQLKILAIGNSFSEDATRYLYQIAADCGATHIVIGNLYIGGCSLNTHWSNARTDSAAYTYFKNTNGYWASTSRRSLLDGLQDEDWDIVTLQQVSGLSGAPETYNYDLINLINYVKDHVGKDVQLGWHMTWAYESSSNHGDFGRYSKDQMTMYRAITNAVQTKILTNKAFSFVIPAGTAIQNARTSFLGDTLTRDGYHLSEDIGRYIAGLTWIKAIGFSLDGVKSLPAGIPSAYLSMMKEAAERAVERPYEVSPSSFVEIPSPYDLSEYALFDWEPVGCAYWNSPAGTGLVSRRNSTASNLINFVASGRQFTRQDLPIGTLIVIDPGYQYRPEGWTNGRNTAANRPTNITAQYVVIDETWWGNYDYRAFNVAVKGATADISGRIEEVASHFRIYIPKSASGLDAPSNPAE
ncbi:MAG: DUF4886 domain-containing protein [Limnochordia bacterium]|jgi:hypothetical protein